MAHILLKVNYNRKNYKPGQLITKSILGHNHVFRLARPNLWDSNCNKCIVPRLDARPIPLHFRAICQWCFSHIGTRLYLKNP